MFREVRTALPSKRPNPVGLMRTMRERRAHCDGHERSRRKHDGHSSPAQTDAVSCHLDSLPVRTGITPASHPLRPMIATAFRIAGIESSGPALPVGSVPGCTGFNRATARPRGCHRVSTRSRLRHEPSFLHLTHDSPRKPDQLIGRVDRWPRNRPTLLDVPCGWPPGPGRTSPMFRQAFGAFASHDSGAGRGHPISQRVDVSTTVESVLPTTIAGLSSS